MMTIFLTILRLFLASKQKHLLVMFQNNYELRGSGGFLTQLLDVTLGRFRFSPAFRHDYHELKPKEFIPAPPDVQKYLHHQHWYLRDSNLSGDFRASARQVIANYRSIFPHHEAAGAVAVNFYFLEKLMGVIGTVRVGTKTFDAENIFTELSTNVSDIDKHNLEELSGRKNILKSLCFGVVRSCMAKFWKWPGIWALVRRSLETKDLQLFFVDERMQSRLLLKGLAHDFLTRDTKDFLAIVENNYLGLKSNRYIRRTVFRDVVFELDHASKKLSDALVRVRIEWKHAGHYNYPLSGTYQSVTRIHVPPAAQDVQILYAPEQPAIEKTPDATVVSVHQILGIQQSSAIEFTYRLPAELFQDGGYSFKFIKQSGVLMEHFHSTLRFPDQFSVKFLRKSWKNGKEENPKLARVTDNVVFLDALMIDRDLDYECETAPNNQRPRIFFHEMTGPNTFEIRFNEAVFLDEPNFSIRVTGRGDSQDYPVKTLRLDQDNRRMVFRTLNVPDEEEKFYTITLTGLVNTVGKPLGKRSLTVVHRSKYFTEQNEQKTDTDQTLKPAQPPQRGTNLVIIFGPPAVGKTTVGKELAAISGYNLFHNHMSVELALNFFDRGHNIFPRLVNDLRKQIFLAAIKGGLKGIIFTCCWALDKAEDNNYISSIQQLFEQNGGKVYFVELAATLEERLKRNTSQDRLDEKPSKRDIDKSEERMLRYEKDNIFNSDESGIGKENYIKIENTNLDPKSTAERIQDAFHL